MEDQTNVVQLRAAPMKSVRKIFKYELEITDSPTLNLPVDANFLAIDQQNGSICLWFVVDPEQKEMKERQFRIIGTGHEIQMGAEHDTLHFLKTLVMAPFVWHVFAVV
jgi:hypothetical protein